MPVLLDDKKSSQRSPKAGRHAVHLVLSRWTLCFVVAALLLPWVVIASVFVSRNFSQASGSSSTHAGRSDDDPASSAGTGRAELLPQEWVSGKKGPWGQIDTMLFAIDLPDEFVFVPAADLPPVRWCFPGYTKEQVLATLRSVGLPQDDVKKLDAGASGRAAMASQPSSRAIP